VVERRDDEFKKLRELEAGGWELAASVN